MLYWLLKRLLPIVALMVLVAAIAEGTKSKASTMVLKVHGRSFNTVPMYDI